MLRDYQKEIYSGVVEAFKKGFHRPLVVAPCGAGKSYIFAEMIRRTCGEVVVLTHRQELKAQHEALFRKLGIRNARVAMVLTEYNRLGNNPKPALIVADEAHLSRSNTWMKVIEYYNTKTVGFSATPVRLDGKPLGNIFDTMVEGVDVRWLIDHHRLAPYEYYAPTEVETESLRVARGDYVIADLEKLMNKKAIYGNVISSYQRFAAGERSIAYCVSVQHAEHTAESFCAVGIPSKAISAGTPVKQRRRIMEDFRAGKITVLCNVGIISEGISIEDVTCCMLLRPTESVALGIQQMMRCMRYLPGKTAKIIDFVGNYTRVGFPDEKREWDLSKPLVRKRRFDENGDFFIRTCTKCFMAFKTAAICPFCGEPYPLHPREIKAHEEIELKRISAEEAARMERARKSARLEQKMARTFEELVALGKSRGYRSPAGWAANVMRARRL